MLIAGLVAAALLAAIAVSGSGHRSSGVMIPHRGIELKAYKGRLVHVRETYSEREL